MKIAMASSELSPVARTGGLGDVLAGLPLQLQKNGHEACTILPYYRSVRDHRPTKTTDTGVHFDIPVGAKSVRAEILEFQPRGGVQAFFIRNDAFFDRPGLYGENGSDYPDNAARFVFFNKAVSELIRRMDPAPDIVHVHDWQAAMVPLFLKAAGLSIRSVLTIHNLAYQGTFPGLDFALTNLPSHLFSPGGVEFYGNMNFLKGGILSADMITTVSEVYARDILTPEFGCGLDRVLDGRKNRLFGILNGADYHVWDPDADKLLPKTYRPGNLSGKQACRQALLEKLRLAPDPAGPVFAMVTRLAEQKGFDILLPILDRLLADDVRLVILGEGDPNYEAQLAIAARKYPDKLRFQKEFDEKLAHLTQAGADISLVPSRLEPCGLSVLYSLRYGTVPVAHSVGGLHQTLRDFDPAGDEGWSVVFYDYTSEALWDSIVRAKRYFHKPKRWRKLVGNAMAQDFSWEKAATIYEAIYTQAIKGHS